MIKKFFNKELWKKILVSFMVVLSLMTLSPKNVEANDLGGKLMQPVIDIIVTIGDATVNILHRVILDQNLTLLKLYNAGWWERNWSKLLVVRFISSGSIFGSCIFYNSSCFGDSSEFIYCFM